MLVEDGALARARVPKDAEDAELQQIGKVHFRPLGEGIDAAKFKTERFHVSSVKSVRNAVLSASGGASPNWER